MVKPQRIPSGFETGTNVTIRGVSETQPPLMNIPPDRMEFAELALQVGDATYPVWCHGDVAKAAAAIPAGSGVIARGQLWQEHWKTADSKQKHRMGMTAKAIEIGARPDD